jgi:hypothetical protein
VKAWKMPNRIGVINPTLSKALERKRVIVRQLHYSIELECQLCHARYSIEVATSPLPRRWWKCGTCHPAAEEGRL